ncbi:hypothetical protein QFC24_000713 [Naganishia onofrii]|uniref:Uncharacterized protein n=1 Tax=Naganishia onofrii TaxID=1851511 RepID=A0ACC2XV89_9TREE|nr:hypothetical protein QFC24_000713 [Naganishia onofrii]
MRAQLAADAAENQARVRFQNWMARHNCKAWQPPNEQQLDVTSHNEDQMPASFGARTLGEGPADPTTGWNASVMEPPLGDDASAASLLDVGTMIPNSFEEFGDIQRWALVLSGTPGSHDTKPGPSLHTIAEESQFSHSAAPGHKKPKYRGSRQECPIRYHGRYQPGSHGGVGGQSGGKTRQRLIAHAQSRSTEPEIGGSLQCFHSLVGPAYT